MKHDVAAPTDTARPERETTSLVVVIMGVAGSGKTTIGSALARELGWNFRDADEFHSPANVVKMSAGIPLTDEDRAPWLAAIAAHIADELARGRGAVVTCSALKFRYRAVLSIDPTRVRFVHLTGDYAVIFERLQARLRHFMKPEMLRSQFEALEVSPEIVSLDVAQPPAALVAAIRQSLAI